MDTRSLRAPWPSGRLSPAPRLVEARAQESHVTSTKVARDVTWRSSCYFLAGLAAGFGAGGPADGR